MSPRRTEELPRRERVGLKIATSTRPRRVPTVTRETVEQVVRERDESITREQAALVHAVAASPDRVVCVVGHAGSGKTRALAALADSFQREGFLAIGAARGGRRESCGRDRHPRPKHLACAPKGAISKPTAFPLQFGHFQWVA
jgi:ABC-type glutathione transport system ATPase component